MLALLFNSMLDSIFTFITIAPFTLYLVFFHTPHFYFVYDTYF